MTKIILSLIFFIVNFYSKFPNMKKLSLSIAIIISCSVSGQNITGKWKTIDDKTGKDKSHVEIYEKDGKFYGKVIHIIDPLKREKVCSECNGVKKNKKVIGMVIIESLLRDGDYYENGTILDPDNGKIYDCKIWVDGNGDMQVRGYLGWFFRTQTWLKI